MTNKSIRSRAGIKVNKPYSISRSKIPTFEERLERAKEMERRRENNRKSNGNGGCLGLLLAGFILANFLVNV